MKRAAVSIALMLSVNNAMAADMRTTLLPRAAEALADEMAPYLGISLACVASDGTNMNRVFWERKIRAAVTQSQYALFAKVARARAEPFRQQMSGPDGPLRCDDALDGVENQYGSIAEGGPAAEPLCRNDVTDTNRCEGTGEDDILAGVPALLNGY